MKTYYVIGLDEDHKPEHTMKIVSRVPVTMDNVSMAFKQLYPNVVIAQEVSGMGVTVESATNDRQAALAALNEMEANEYWRRGDFSENIETIRAALTAPDVNAEQKGQSHE